MSDAQEHCYSVGRFPTHESAAEYGLALARVLRPHSDRLSITGPVPEDGEFRVSVAVHLLEAAETQLSVARWLIAILARWAVAGAWQPFATAPKDRAILTWNCNDPMDGHAILEWYPLTAGGHWIDSSTGDHVTEPYFPTHWHELPAAPAS